MGCWLDNWALFESISNWWFFSSDNRKLSEYKKHVTLEIIKNWHQSNESGGQLTNSVNRKFQIVQNREKFLQMFLRYLLGVWCPTSSRSDREWVTRSFWKKKKRKSNKTGCNQNTPALPLFRWSVALMDIKFFSSCSVQRIRVFLLANQLILLRYHNTTIFLYVPTHWCTPPENRLILGCKNFKMF